MKITQYKKISDYYSNLIKSGKILPGGKIPTEEEICDTFRVSRITARNALTILQNEGLIYKIQGKGAFVSHRNTEKIDDIIQNFHRKVQAMGKTPSTTCLSCLLVDPNEEVKKELSVEKGLKVYEITRLRFIDDVPVSYEKTYIPFYLVAGIENYDLSTSLYDIVETNYGIIVHSKKERVSPGLLLKETAKLLRKKEGDPCLLILRRTFDENKESIAFSKVKYVDELIFSAKRN